MEDTNYTIAKIIHEIRNPLTLISGSLQIIEASHPEVRSFDAWEQTMMDVEYLTQLLDDLSVYSSDNHFYLCKADLREILISLEGSLKLLMSAQNKQFRVHLPDSLPPVSGSSVRLRQAFLNLLKNAFEAIGEDGCVTLSAKAEPDRIFVTISDNGCGMTEETLKTLFTPFSSSKAGGTGLGLTVTRKIILAHQGRIQVDSEPGAGTIFTVTLPCLTA